jgi:hypothetical protein
MKRLMAILTCPTASEAHCSVHKIRVVSPLLPRICVFSRALLLGYGDPIDEP